MKLQQILHGKTAFKLVSNNFLQEKYTRFFCRQQVVKGLTLKMV